MFRGYLVFIFYFWYLGCNVYAWNTVHINYKLAFNFDNHYSTVIEILKRAAFFSFVVSFMLLCYMILRTQIPILYDLVSFIPYTAKFIRVANFDGEAIINSIKIKNMSGTDCRYAEIKATTEDGDFEFVLTTLKDGDSVAVLEKNKKSCKEKFGIKSIAIEKFAAFDEKPQLCEDIFELTVNNRVINIKNISDKDIDGTIYVYYKNQKDNILFGGITYRIPFDSLKAGELKQASSKHLSKKNSVLEFVTYEH